MISKEDTSITISMWCYDYCVSKILERFVGKVLIWNIQFQIYVAQIKIQSN